MEELFKEAAAKDHPDAIWLLASRGSQDSETDPNYAQQILRADDSRSVICQLSSGGRRRPAGGQINHNLANGKIMF